MLLRKRLLVRFPYARMVRLQVPLLRLERLGMLGLELRFLLLQSLGMRLGLGGQLRSVLLLLRIERRCMLCRQGLERLDMRGFQRLLLRLQSCGVLVGQLCHRGRMRCVEILLLLGQRVAMLVRNVAILR